MSERGTLAGAAPAGGADLWDWYPALRVDELSAGKMSKAMLLGIPLVLGRKKDGAVFALRDLCPHRGIPLSAGWFDGETVQCKYHGWRFEPCSGQCPEIPSLTSHDSLDPTKIFATAYPCVERDGYAWVYVPEPGVGRVGGELPPVPELPKFSDRYRSAHLVAELPCNVDHGIIGLMDPAQGRLCTRPGGGGAGRVSTRRPSCSSHWKTKRTAGEMPGFGCLRMLQRKFGAL